MHLVSAAAHTALMSVYMTMHFAMRSINIPVIIALTILLGVCYRWNGLHWKKVPYYLSK